jgi:predicted permease
MSRNTGLLADVRYAVRMMGKLPGFTAVAVLALAFGIGVNSAIFTLLNAVALRPPQVRDANEVLNIYQLIEGAAGRSVHGSRSYLSYPEYVSYRDGNHVFSGLAAYAVAPLTLGGAEAARVQGHLATCNYFPVLAGPLALGRGFMASECDALGQSPVVVLSHSLWQRRFAGDPEILGRQILLNRTLFTVIGVAPRNFAGASLFAADMWAPITMWQQWKPGSSGMLTQDNLSWLEVAGRLKPGVSLASARADLGVIARRIDHSTPGRQTTLAVDRATLLNQPEERKPVIAVSAILLAAVSLILLIACANLANLLLARATARRKEIAVRLAVGATRFRLIRQLVTESLLLSVLGGALGLVAAWWTLNAVFPVLMSGLPPDSPSFTLNLTPDRRILLYSLAVSFVTGVAFGLLPASQASKLDLSSELKGAGPGGGRSQGWLRGALVTTQVAVCLVLLVAAGLLARGLRAAQTLDHGLDLAGVTAASFDLQLQGYDRPKAAMFHRQLAERLARLPGVAEVASTAVLPLSASRTEGPVRVEAGDAPRMATLAHVSANYLTFLRIPIVQDRGFEARDMLAGSRATIVNASTAHRLWPNQNPVGRSLLFGRDTAPLEIIGVAKDVRHTSLSEVDPLFLYLPATPAGQAGISVLVRASASHAIVAKAIRDQAKALDVGVLVQTSRLEDGPDLLKLPARISAGGALGIGLVGLLLATMGIYGVVAYAVAQRTREIGIRMALGARRGDLARLILIQAMRPVALGVGLGLAGCAAVSRVLDSLLFGVSPLDPFVFGGVALFLAAVALLASYMPARRAMRVDPLLALRES